MKILYICVAIASAVCLYFTESRLYSTQGCLNEASISATTLAEPIHEKENENKLVFVSIPYPPTLDGHVPTDPFFGIEMPRDAAVGKRKTEYCQWKELRHSKTTKVGQKPDTCVKKSEGKAAGVDQWRAEALTNFLGRRG